MRFGDKMEGSIKQFIKESSLSNEDKLSIKFLVDSLENGINQFTDKTFLFEGAPGIGKTYFVESLLKMLDFPIFYLGPFKFESKNIKSFENFKQLVSHVKEIEEGIVYIDDIQNSLEVERDGMGEVHLEDAEGKRFIALLESIKRSKKKLFLIMTVNDSDFMEECWKDRIETSITLLEPSEKSKKVFLKKKYSNIMGKKIINEIASKTIGYNFRNLDELIRIAYRIGEGKFSLHAIGEALSSYTPTGLSYFSVEPRINLGFKDVIGNLEIKKELKKLSLYIKQRKKLEKLQIKKSNLLVFSGDHGIGKTHMARALAGELKIPLIKFDSNDLGRGPRKFLFAAKRYGNCVLFIDEAEKHFGLHSYALEEEGNFLADFNKGIDDASNEIKGIVILSVNNTLRLGKALRERFNIIEFRKPSYEDRKEYIRKLLEKSQLSMNFDAEDIASTTEGRNYRELQRIWNEIVFYYLDNNEMNKDIVRSIISPNFAQVNPVGIG